MKPGHRQHDSEVDDLGMGTPVDDDLFAVPPPLDMEPAARQSAPASSSSDGGPLLGALWRAMRRRKTQAPL